MKQEILQKIKDSLGDISIDEAVVTKNNGIKHNTVRMGIAGSDIGMNICIDDVPEDKLADYIIKVYNDNVKDVPAWDIESMMKKENLLARAYPQLINRDKNSELLTRIAHEPYLDLEIVYRIAVDDESSFLVRKDLLEYAGLTLAELHESAINNIKGSGEVKSIGEMINKAMGKDVAPEDDFSMMIVKSDKCGASIVLDTNVLEEARFKVKDNLYIIPSSISEVIAIPMGDVNSCEVLRDMVKTVNRDSVPESEILSDTVYVYKDGKLMVAE